jgi:hypothetical protein
MPAPKIDEYERLLRKRGFKREDSYWHVCEACGERAAFRLGLQGRLGGRDFELCAECGKVRSWSRPGGSEERVEDVGFDIDAFLR